MTSSETKPEWIYYLDFYLLTIEMLKWIYKHFFADLQLRIFLPCRSALTLTTYVYADTRQGTWQILVKEKKKQKLEGVSGKTVWNKSTDSIPLHILLCLNHFHKIQY